MAAAAVDLFLERGERRAVTTDEGPGLSEEERLVEALRRGEREAFDAIHARYASLVHGILLARLPRFDVEDLEQEVFLTVFRRIRTLREAKSFGGWIAMIARNRATDYHRRARETEELPRDLEAKDSSEPEARAILDVIRSLPEAYREPLVLRLVEGMTGPEIAARTGLTPGSVRVNLHRGMRQLREELSRSQIHG